MRSLFPVFLKLDGKPCLVVGGGDVAERKVEALLEAGAEVAVLSPTFTARLASLAQTGRVKRIEREYAPGDLEGYAVVVETTGIASVSEAVAHEARTRGALLNTADVPERCDFFFPAVHRTGDLVLAASTRGVAPGLAARICRTWEREFDGRYATFLEAYHHYRDEVKRRFPDDAAKRKRLLEAVLDSSLLDEASNLNATELFRRMMSWIS